MDTVDVLAKSSRSSLWISIFQCGDDLLMIFEASFDRTWPSHHKSATIEHVCVKINNKICK